MESNLYETLGQVSSTDAGQIFRDHLRGCVRQMICEVMAAEVDELCGAKHQPSGGDHFRAGSSTGRVIFEGEREAVVRPRVRKRGSDGGSEEAVLATYQAARDPNQLQDSIVTALMHVVCAAGGREGLPSDLRLRRPARVDRGLGGETSELGQSQNFAGP